MKDVKFKSLTVGSYFEDNDTWFIKIFPSYYENGAGFNAVSLQTGARWYFSDEQEVLLLEDMEFSAVYSEAIL